MKNIKIVLVTFLATLVLSVGFSVGAFLVVDVGASSPGSSLSVPKLSEAEQIAKGYKYNIYTGVKLNIPTPTSTTTSTAVVPTLSATELRFRAIEARLDKLENK